MSTITRATALRHKVFEIKMRQVAQTGASTLVSSCANCRHTFDDAKAHYRWDHPIESLVELVAEHLEE